MSEERRSEDTSSERRNTIDRRKFLVAGAAGLAAAGAGLGTASAQPAPGKKPKTNSTTGTRTAIVTDTRLNIGPHLARKFAQLNYTLVIADVPDGLPEELRELGAAKVVVVPGLEQEGPNNESKPGAIQKLVDAATDKYGGFDSVFIRTAIHVGKNILEETVANMQISYEQNCLAVMYALQAVLPPLMKAGAGQVVVQTSATGEKPQPTMMSYSVMRAAADMMVRCAAMTVAPKGVCVNAVGTNFMNYPGFKRDDGRRRPQGHEKHPVDDPDGTSGRRGRGCALRPSIA